MGRSRSGGAASVRWTAACPCRSSRRRRALSAETRRRRTCSRPPWPQDSGRRPRRPPRRPAPRISVSSSPSSAASSTSGGWRDPRTTLPAEAPRCETRPLPPPPTPSIADDALNNLHRRNTLLLVCKLDLCVNFCYCVLLLF
jgi:hypothetical protein